jgi:hypothetical protein
MVSAASTAPGLEPKSREKISSAGRSIGAINPLPISLWTKRALLFSQASRLVSPVRPFSVCAPFHRRPWKMSDATGSFISAQRPIPDRTAPGPDRRHRRREPAGRRRVGRTSPYFSEIKSNSASA